MWLSFFLEEWGDGDVGVLEYGENYKLWVMGYELWVEIS